MCGFVSVILVPILLLVLAGVSMRGRKAMHELAEHNTPPGRMADVGGYELHINCQSGPDDAAGPAVILESGNGENSLGWHTVQQEVGRFAAVCSYDRAGLGWSDRGPKARTTENIVAELHMLLERAGCEPPFVLVGHSIGGIFVRYYANQYPQEVVGLVLVDPGHEEQTRRYPPKIQKFQGRFFKLSAWGLRLGQLATAAGFSALGTGAPQQMLVTVPEDVQGMLSDLLASRPVIYKTIAEETSAAEENMAMLGHVSLRPLGDMPLVVLSSGTPMHESQERQLSGLGIPEADIRTMQQVQNDMHEELAALSTSGKRVIAEESGHHIQVDQPELVVQAIREVIEAVQKKSAAVEAVVQVH